MNRVEAIRILEDSINLSRELLGDAKGRGDKLCIDGLQREIAAHEMAIAALREQEEREKPPLTIGDAVRRMDDEDLALQFASLMVGGVDGFMQTIGMTPNVEQMMTIAYQKMLDEVKKPVPPKEEV